MKYPFGEIVQPLIQQDRTPKKVFVLGVYASAVHARWKRGNKIVCQALAVASEPRIFWDGNQEEAKQIISRIRIPTNNQIDTRQINIRKKSKFNHVCTAVSQLPFPAGSIGKECAYNARNVGDVDSMPGLGKYPGEEIGNPL